jgi:hypothetical protein
MQETFIRALQGRRAQIRARWETFLRIEKVNTPLANPDTLVYLFDQTLNEVFHALAEPHPGRPAPPPPARDKNPLYAYFLAGEQAMLEALILIQAGASGLDPKERDADVAHLRHIMHKIARRDIESLEGAFQSKKQAAHHVG